MVILIKNVKVYRENAWRQSEILISGSSIERIADCINCTYDGLKIVDGKGMYAIPGFIDQHVHITGGGGEGGFITQIPPMKLSAPVKAGVTTLVGLLGTDGTTRSVSNLVARTKALNEFGLTAFCLTGNYNYPSPTLTGSVINDIVFVNEIIGVKVAISDHRSANMKKEDMTKLASDARVAGLLSGKAGVVHIHVGTGKAQLDMLFDIIRETDIPISVFRPTHIGKCFDSAIKFANMGGYIDFTCHPDEIEKDAALIVKAMEGVPAGLVTMSTDSNGSMPIWNEKREMVGIGAGRISVLPDTVVTMVKKLGYPLEKAILPATENVAKALGLYPQKGTLADGSDADIVLLDRELLPDTIYARGRCMMAAKELKVHEKFEDT